MFGKGMNLFLCRSFLCLNRLVGKSEKEKPAERRAFDEKFRTESGLRAFHVFAGAGINLDLLAGLDEERGLHGNAGFQCDGFLNVVG